MKAIAKTRPAPGAELIETPVPRPGEGELLVKVAACGICGSDLHIYEWESAPSARLDVACSPRT